MADRHATYEGSDEERVRAWIEDVLEKKLEGESLHECLRSGVVLCELLKKISPAACTGKVSKLKMPFPMRENIKLFIDGVKGLSGFKEQYVFTTEDLFEGKDMKQVVVCILTLARLAHDIETFTGPLLGAAELRGSTNVTHAVVSDALWGKVGGSYS